MATSFNSCGWALIAGKGHCKKLWWLPLKSILRLVEEVYDPGIMCQLNSVNLLLIYGITKWFFVFKLASPFLVLSSNYAIFRKDMPLRLHFCFTWGCVLGIFFFMKNSLPGSRQAELKVDTKGTHFAFKFGSEKFCYIIQWPSLIFCSLHA
jgi:hypothetical protein